MKWNSLSHYMAKQLKVNNLLVTRSLHLTSEPTNLKGPDSLYQPLTIYGIPQIRMLPSLAPETMFVPPGEKLTPKTALV